MSSAAAAFTGPCPKCGYARSAADSNPAWQCPRCGIAYHKYNPARAALRTQLARTSKELAGDALLDRSTVVLIAANLIAAGIAVAQDMSLRDMMLVYWIQSVAIGLSFLLRMFSLRQFSTEGLSANGRPVPETPAGRNSTALFFLVHYGFFHLAYLLFLTQGPGRASPAPATDATGLWLCALALLISHTYSLFENIQLDRQGKPNLGVLMFLPYARILPMHLTIVFGGWIFGGGLAVLLFTLLKTAADVVMHLVEHRVLRGGPRPPAIARN